MFAVNATFAYTYMYENQQFIIHGKILRTHIVNEIIINLAKNNSLFATEAKEMNIVCKFTECGN